jgi:hypothetical protein
VEDRALVLQILRGVSDRYAHIRSLIVRQRPFPTYLQVRDNLLMEEITLGGLGGSSSAGSLSTAAGSSASSTTLAATPPARPLAPYTPPLAPLPTGPSGGGGGRGQGTGGGKKKKGKGGGGRGGGGRPWRSTAAATSSSCLALLQQPLVRAHRDVALPGTWWRASSTGRHVRGCPSGVLSTGVPPDDPVGHTFRRLTGAGRLESGGPGTLLLHLGLDTSCRPGVDRRLGCHLPHHPGLRYTLFYLSSFFLTPFVYHGRQWLMSSCHVRGYRRCPRLFSPS